MTSFSMVRRFVSCLLLILPLPPVLASDTLLLQNATLLDLQNAKSFEGHLLIRDGHVVQVLRGDTAPVGVRTLDLHGKWIIPGLYDMHVHAFGNMAPGRAGSAQPFELDVIGWARAARLMLYAGVSGYLDLFAPEDDFFEARRQQRALASTGADIYGAGPCFTVPNGHCSEYGVPTRLISSPQEARRQVAELAPKRPDVFKLVYDHSNPRPTVSRSTMEAFIAAVHAHRGKALVHAGTWQDVADAATAGADHITHVPADGVVSDEIVELLRRNRVYFSPTLAVFTELAHFAEDPLLLATPLVQSVASRRTLLAYREPASYGPLVQRWMARGAATQQIRYESLRKLATAGVRIVAGTDSGNLGTFLGFSLHRELELMVAAGMTPWQALRSASLTPAEFLGIKAGFEPGAIANLLVLESSPIENIANTRRISAVIHRGEIVNRAALLTYVSEPEDSNPPQNK